jgi:hypothetical protein
VSEIYLPKLIDKVSDFVTGLKGNWQHYKGHVQDYEAHKAETEADNVHGLQDLVAALTGLFGMEIGQNENGSWVRWNNGLQVCWNYFGTTEFLMTDYTDYDGLRFYRYDLTVTYPKSFISSPVIIPTGNPQHHADLGTNAAASYPTDAVIRIHSLRDFTLCYAVGYLAIGWWKTPEDPAEWSEE